MAGTRGAAGAEALRLSLFGAAGTNANLGVRALMVSVVTGVRHHAYSSDITVFDDGFGVGAASVPSNAGPVGYRRCGARFSRRVYRQESYWNVRLSMRTVPLANRVAKLLLQSDAVLDITGGDSFTDLYGDRRFAASLASKKLSLEAGRRLILLPQTYGPFGSLDTRREAADALRGATAVWARDETSYGTVMELLGEAFDPDRHRLGVDVAFGLEAVAPPEALRSSVSEFLERQRGAPLVGINVSGLLYNDPHASVRYGLGFDYRALMVSLLHRLLSETDAAVMLVDHVLAPAGKVEADRAASSDLIASVPEKDCHRILRVSDAPGPSEVKWCISRCDWFVGARMHATIAALSSGVPTAAVAYSHKVVGVFASCGLEGSVADVGTDFEGAMTTIWDSFEQRAVQRSRLGRQLPAVLDRASSQMREIVASCRTSVAER
jgi:colanic acid/amylovoran biosynthesis protein